MSSEEFKQYEVRTNDGAHLLVAQQADQVVVLQSSQGAVGRGALHLSPSEAADLARQIQAASEAARRYTPPPPLDAAPIGLPLSPAANVQQALAQLGLTPEAIQAAIRAGVDAELARREAAGRKEPTE